jgi:hypothetical protein
MRIKGSRRAVALCVLGLTVLFGSCHQQEQHTLVPKDWSTVSISLSQGWCQLSCPTYSFTIRGNGEIEYEGMMGVPVLGRRTGLVPRETVAALLKEFEKANFMSLDNRFQCDHSNLYVTLSMDGKTKTVTTCGVTTEETPEPSAAQVAQAKHLDKNWKAWLAYSHLPHTGVAMLGTERWTKCGRACTAAVRLRSQHLWVGEDAVLDAVQGKLPEAVSSMGVDSYALIEAGYDVNYADKEGITPLMAATEKNDSKLARNLLECGARPTEIDKLERTALDRVGGPEMRDVFRWYGNVSAAPSGD